MLSLIAALALLATGAACAQQSDGLGGAAVPQEAPAGAAVAEQPEVDPALPIDTPSAPGDAASDALGAGAAPDAGIPTVAPKPPTLVPLSKPWAVANGAVLDGLRTDIVAVAVRVKNRLRRDSISYASDGRSTIVNGAVENIDALTPTNLAGGAVIGVVYLAVPAADKQCPPNHCPDVPPPNLPPPPNLAASGAVTSADGAAASDDIDAAPDAAMTPPPESPALMAPMKLPAGYYAVKVITDRTGTSGKAQFIDASGNIQSEAPITTSKAMKAKRPSTEVALSAFKVCFSWTSSSGNTISVCITLDNSSM